MLRSLELLEGFAHVVEGETGAKAKGSGPNPVWWLSAVLLDRETGAEGVVDHLLEAPSGSPRALPEFGRHVVIECERRSYIMMLDVEHCEVNVLVPPFR